MKFYQTTAPNNLQKGGFGHLNNKLVTPRVKVKNSFDLANLHYNKDTSIQYFMNNLIKFKENGGETE